MASYPSFMVFKLRLLELFLARVFEDEVNNSAIYVDFETPSAWCLNDCMSVLFLAKGRKEILQYKGKDCFKRVVPRAGAYPSFCSMKRLGVFLLPPPTPHPPDGMLVHCRTPAIAD